MHISYLLLDLDVLSMLEVCHRCKHRGVYMGVSQHRLLGKELVVINTR